MDDKDVDNFIICQGIGFATGFGMSPSPPAKRPEWLKPYAFVTGYVDSAPLDLEKRMEQVYAKLKALGWTVAVKSIGTDFGPIPVPKSQPVELYLHRTDKPYTEKDAQSALGSVLRSMNMAYFATGAWAGELVSEVVVPTIQQATEVVKEAATTTSRLLPFVAIGLAALAVMIYLPKPSRG